MSKKKWFVLTLMLTLALWNTALAQSDDPAASEPIVLTDEQDRFLLGQHLEILEDPGGALTIEDVTSPDFEARFVPSQDEVPIYGFTESAYWIRLPLRNESRLTGRWLLDLGFANMHYVDLYTPNPDGNGFDVKQTGSFRPPASRDLREPRIVFDLMVPAEDELTYYLRLESGASMTFPLTAWMPDAFFIQSKMEHALAGIYFGAIFALLAYNLFLFVSLREKSYLYLLTLLAGMVIFEASYAGYTEVYFFPALYFLNFYYLAISFALLFVSMLMFADAFLELKTHLPKLHWLSIILVAVWGVLILLAPVITYFDYVQLAVPLALASMATVLIVGTVAGRRGISHSRLFMIAWSGLVLGLVIVLLVRVGIMPSNLFSEKAYRLGLLWLGICWSLALADRVNMLKNDIQRNERRLSQILEGLPLGVVMYEKDQRPSYINQRVNEILSNPVREIRPDVASGRTLAQTMEYFSFRVAGSDRQYALEEMPIFRALRGEPATADDIEADLIDRRVPLEIWASPVKDAQGEVESAIVAFQDITRRKQTEAELAVHRDNLESLVAERTAQLNELNEVLNHEAAERKLLADTQIKLIGWLSAINHSHQLLRGSADLPQAHKQLLREISQLLGAKHAFLGLCDESKDRVNALTCLRYVDSSAPVENLQIACEPGSPLRDLVDRNEIVILSADCDNPILAPLEACQLGEEVSSAILAPIQNERGAIGLLGLGMTQPADSFTPEEITLIERIRYDLARVTEYAWLYDSARTLAAAEERTRLARDLHDSVTQVLFSASLLAEALPTIWRRDPVQAEESLEGLRRLTRGALAEMRSLLLELRPAALLTTSLSELISQLTEAVTSRSGLPFHLLIEQIPVLPEDVHVSFYRVAQEALNNAVKHAQASRVEVKLGLSSPPQDVVDPDDFSISLTILDNGVGISSANGQSGNMGLGIMHERAAAIGADLWIESQPGRGTEVTMNWTGKPGNRHA